MKKMVLVLTLAAFALSGSAFAQDPNWNDNIGTYLSPTGYIDPAGPGGSCGFMAPDELFTVYVVLSRLTNPEVHGWEAKITTSNMTVLATTYHGQVLDVAERDFEYIVGMSSPLFAVDNAVVVLELLCQVNSTLNDPLQPSTIFIDGIFRSSINPNNGPPAYEATGTDTIVELHPALGDPWDFEIPQLVINGDCDPVGVEESTWGNVKSLYR